MTQLPKSLLNRWNDDEKSVGGRTGDWTSVAWADDMSLQGRGMAGDMKMARNGLEAALWSQA